MTVQEFLASDRQWLRPQRIAHYKYMLACAVKAADMGQIEFWTACLLAVTK